MKKFVLLTLNLIFMMTMQAQTKEKAALLLIETQNEWMHPQGKLYKALVEDQALMQQSIQQIEKALTYARNHNLTVIHVGLSFTAGYPELGLATSGLRHAIPKAGTFQAGAFGTSFYETVQPIEGEFIVKGRTGASAFTGSNLDVYLRNNHIGKLFLVGYATHVCVESTFRDAHERGYHAVVLSDATAAFNATQQQYFLDEIVHHFGSQQTTEAFTSSK